MTTPALFSSSRSMWIKLALVLSSVLLLPAAHAQSAAGMPGNMNKSMPMTGMDMRPMMVDMQDRMTAVQTSGNTDVDFAMLMRVHHQTAITMAEAELQNGKDPQMRVMARDIIYAQKKEIAVFDKFLAKRGVPDIKMGSPAMPMRK